MKKLRFRLPKLELTDGSNLSIDSNDDSIIILLGVVGWIVLILIEVRISFMNWSCNNPNCLLDNGVGEFGIL